MRLNILDVQELIKYKIVKTYKKLALKTTHIQKLKQKWLHESMIYNKIQMFILQNTFSFFRKGNLLYLYEE